jgi:NAD(P)-dependent dehydrogenase (short-subunit alcohol dehydrogenase family)
LRRYTRDMTNARQERSVVVGASSGIGRASAELLARSGHEVLAIGRDRAKLADLEREAAGPAYGGRLSVRAADASDVAETRSAFEAFGSFAHLVLALSSARGRGLLATLDLAELRAGFEGKYWPHVATLQASLPFLDAAGSITLITAGSSGAAYPGTAGLAAINGALEAMVPVLAVELAPRRVNAVSPGIIDTPWWRRSVLVIGSGPIVIGQAAEFDYAGVQACRALREEGHRVVLVNSNPATIMTDPEVADAVYLEPLTVASLEAIIARERPTRSCRRSAARPVSTSPSNWPRAASSSATDIELLGHAARNDRAGRRSRALQRGDARDRRAGAASAIVTDVEAASRSGRAGYPLVIRPAYTLGGTGGGVVRDEAELRETLALGLEASLIHQALVETSCSAGKKSSTKSCATAPTTASSFATWRTSIRSAFTPATRSSSRRRRRSPTSSTRCCAPRAST